MNLTMDATQQKINDYLLWLYADNQFTDIHDFKKQAMDKLAELIPFDSGLWFTGSAVDQKHDKRAAYLHNQPLEMLENFIDHKKQDGLLIAMLAQPNQTLDLYDIVPEDVWRASDNYTQHCDQYDIEWIIASLLYEEESSIYHIMSLYRGKRATRFTPQDKAIKQQLMPHLINAMKNNLFIQMETSVSQHNEQWKVGICDYDGMLRQANSQFMQRFKLAFPNWQGGLLPFPLDLTQQEQRIELEHDWLHCHLKEDFIYLKFMQKHLADALTLKEKLVCQKLQNGLTNKEIANEMAISHVTVRNHFTNIFKKLGAKTRSDVVTKLSDYQF